MSFIPLQDNLIPNTNEGSKKNDTKTDYRGYLGGGKYIIL